MQLCISNKSIKIHFALITTNFPLLTKFTQRLQKNNNFSFPTSQELGRIQAKLQSIKANIIKAEMRNSTNAIYILNKFSWNLLFKHGKVENVKWNKQLAQYFTKNSTLKYILKVFNIFEKSAQIVSAHSPEKLYQKLRIIIGYFTFFEHIIN